MANQYGFRQPAGGLTPETIHLYCTVENDCWIWRGRPVQRSGYARITVNGKSVYAHRAVYQVLIGPIPEGLQIDHLCRVRNCVNPNHLEPVTAAENVRRASALQTHCVHGHPFDSANTLYYPSRPTWRKCRTCECVRRRAQWARYVALREAVA